MTRHDRFLHSYQVGQSARMMRKLALPGDTSQRALVAVFIAFAVIVAMALAGCNDGLPLADLSTADMREFSTCPDCSTDGGLTVSTNDGGMQ